jgi:hypothetical protein
VFGDVFGRRMQMWLGYEDCGTYGVLVTQHFRARRKIEDRMEETEQTTTTIRLEGPLRPI